MARDGELIVLYVLKAASAMAVAINAEATMSESNRFPSCSADRAVRGVPGSRMRGSGAVFPQEFLKAIAAVEAAVK